MAAGSSAGGTRTARAYDLLVVGGGTAGLVGAHTAALLGARVALVERARLGGDCLWTGCVPSKALLAAAARAADVRAALRPEGVLGVHTEGVRVDGPAVLAHVRGAIATIEPADSAETLEAAGVDVLTGDARFEGPGSVSVDGRDVPWRRLLLATGSEPVVPGVPGLGTLVPVRTTDTVWDLDALPGRLVVLGAGPVGCELSQAFARLGATVTLVEVGARILPGEDPDAAAAVRRALEADGVEVLTGCETLRAEDGGVVVAVSAHAGDDGGSGQGLGRSGPGGDGRRRSLPCDLVLAAAGRRPRTDGLGLELAGIPLDDDGAVPVDSCQRTVNPRVWAAGDVTPAPRYTHLAGAAGSVAASNAVLGLRRRVDRGAVPRVTYTDPEVAAVGAPTWTAGGGDGTGPATGPVRRVVTRSHGHVDRAVAEGRTDGFARLAVGRGSRVVGATVVGPRAGETLAELTLAVGSGLRVRDVAGAIHPYPTYGDGPWNAALDDVRRGLSSRRARAVTGLVVRLRRLRSSSAATSAAPTPSAGSPRP